MSPAATPTFTWDDQQEQKPQQDAGGFKWDDSPAPAQATAPVQRAQPAPVRPPDTIGPAPSAAHSVLSEIEHPLNYLDSLGHQVSRPANATMAEMAATDATNFTAGVAHTIRHPIDTAGAILSQGFGLRPIVEHVANDVSQQLGGRKLYTPAPIVPQTPEDAAYALGQTAPIAALGAGYSAFRSGLAARLGKGIPTGAPVPDAAVTPPPAPEVSAPTPDVPDQPGGPAGPGGGPAPAPTEPRPSAGSTGNPAAPQQPAGPATQPAQPGKPTITLEHEPSLLDQVAAHTEALDRARAQTEGASPADIRALRDAVEETGRRAHDAGDMATVEKAAHADIALSQLLNDAIRATNEKGATAPPAEGANLNAAAAALTGKPISDVAVGKGGFTWDDQKPGGPKPVTPDKIAAVLGTAKAPIPPQAAPAPLQPATAQATNQPQPVGAPEPATGRPILQATDNPATLQQAAEAQAPWLEQQANATVQGINGAKVDAVREKKEAADLGEKLNKEGQPAATIPDYLGGRITVDSPAAREQVVQRIRQTMPVVKETDNFEKGSDPYGFHAHTFQVRTPDGNSAELQVVPKEQADVNDQTHGLYEKGEKARIAGDQRMHQKIAQVVRSTHDVAMQAFNARNHIARDMAAKQGTDAASVAQRNQQQAPAQIKPGDAVTYPTSGGKMRPGKVVRIDGDNAYVRDGFTTIKKPLAKLQPEGGTPVKPGTEQTSNQVAKPEVPPPSTGVTPQSGASEQGEEPTVKAGKWIGVDLDGTLAHYEGFKGPTVIGEPIAPMVDRVKGWLKEGKTVKILTARVSEDPTGETKRAIQDWTEKHIGQRLDVTDVKDAHMTALYDDRAVPVERNTGKLLAQPQPEGNQNANESRNGSESPAATAPSGERSDKDAVREPEAAGLLQREPGQDRPEGSGRIQPGEQGQGTSGAGAGSEAKPLGGPGGGEKPESGKIAGMSPGDGAGDKSTQPNAAPPAGAEPLDLQDAIDRFKDEWPTLALRAQNGEEANLKVGSRLRQSSHWVDNIKTSRTMPGTASFLLEDSTRSNEPSDVLESMSGWGYKGFDRFVLIGSKEDPIAIEEMPEQYARAIPKAKILAIVKNPFDAGKPSDTSTAPAKGAEHKHKFGNTQADIPADSPAGRALAALRAKIDPADLMGEGLVEDSHITVRYGIQGDDTAGIRAYLEKQEPFEAELGQTDEFPASEHSDGAVPIIVPIKSVPLRRMEKEIDQHGDFAERSFPQYKPHVTVAYVKPEAAHKYVGDQTAMGKTFTVKSVSITDRDGGAEEVPLKGKPSPSFYKPKTPQVAPIAGSTPLGAKGHKPSKETQDAARAKRNAELAEHFTPGNVIHIGYWNSYDKVLEFHPGTADKQWSVEVIDTDKEGNPLPNEQPRRHSTHPEARDTIVKRGEPTPAPVEKPAPEEQGTGVDALINAIYDKIKSGQSLGNVTELNKMAERYLGSSRTSGEWTPKDLFDAMEAAVNKHLLDVGKRLLQEPAEQALGELRELMGRITSQGTRTEDQIKNQQFSTPPTEAYVVARVAALKASDVVLEPSAGNGGIAVWPLALGAEVHVNEIAERRQKMLEAVGFDKPTAVDGELVNALLPESIQPTVILMNPPFSASTQKSYEAKNQMRYGFNHVEQALQRLAPGGRLVAILGGGREGFQASEGANLRTGEAGKWFDKIAQQYNVRANIRVSGKEYQKYGTSYATRIIVIDKDGPTPSKVGPDRDWSSVVEKDVDTLEEAYNVLRPVEESRPSNAGNGSENARRPGGGSAKAGLVPDTDTSVSGVRSGTGRGPGADGEVSAPIRPDRARPGSPTPRPAGGSEQLPVHRPGSETERRDEGEAAPGAGAGAENGDTQRQVAERGIDLEREEAKAQREEEEESSAYTAYQPTLKGAKHPGTIVETKSMATVPMPPLTYKPNLPESAVGKGSDYENAKLSAVQLEAIAVAGMQNDIILPGGSRGSALIGDGTGVGKGREAAAILWDNWRKGRRRLVWMTKSKDLIVDAIRDLEAIGAHELARTIKNLGKMDASSPIEHDGILFTTYALFRSGDKKGNTRANQIDKWLRGADDGDGGYLLMDESHNLKNAVVSQGAQASQIGQTVKKFLEKMPKLRTVSLSATAATDVMNLGYLDRLGLWGPGTPFPNGFNQFAGEIAHGGMSAMEMIARELKAQGKYVSRTLTYRGVEYREIKHEINPDQKAIYAAAAQAWRDVFESAEHTITHTTGGGARQKAMAMSQFFSAQQRFFNLLLTSIKIPTAVKEAEAALARGESVAITLVNTNEAAQNREKDRVAADDSGEEPDYDFGPGKLITDMVEEHYPTQQYKDDVDSNGNPIKVPVVDAKGNPVQNPQAVAAKNELLRKLTQLRMPANPLDDLIEQLGGPSKVAELTGRKQRYDSASNRLVNRGGNGVSQDKVNKAEEGAFQSGRKRVAILSSAADTGISLHSDKGAKNQQKRFVITLQVGWSADKQMQMNGRFNRSNQANAPEFALLKTDLGGESRFISSIARRMESLEALSKGQTKTNTGTEAMSKVNFETDQGRAAAVAFYNSLLSNRDVPGALDANGEQLSGRDILRQLRVLKGASGGGETVPPADRSNITRLLNRLLALDPDIQQPVYNYFYDIFDATVRRAEADGTLDTGVKRLPGDSFDIKEQRVLSSDPATGANTFYYPIESQVRVHRMDAKTMEERFDKLKKSSDHPIIMRGPNGELAMMADASPIVHADGKIQEAVHVMMPNALYASKEPASKYHNWKAIDAEARDRVEKAEDAIEQADREIVYYGNSIKRGQANGYGRDYEKEELERATKDKEDAQKELKEAKSALRKMDPVEMAQEEWQKQFEAAPAHRTATHHLIGGAVMRFWNPIREASGRRLDVFSAVDSKSGDRVVGIEIPGNQINSLLARITGGKSVVDAHQIIDDVFKNATQYELEGGIKVRRGRVAGTSVIQFVTSNSDVQAALKSMGVLYERGVQPVYYLPTGDYGGWSQQGEDILKKVLEQYPAKVSAAKDDTDEAPEQPKSNLGGTFYSGFGDPELFKQLFPALADSIAQWASNEPTTASTQKEIMRQKAGEMDRRIAIAVHMLRRESKGWRTRSHDDSIKFWNAVEQGRLDLLDPKDRHLAEVFKHAFDSMRAQLQRLKPEILQNYIENYFPHIWERPSMARAAIRGYLTGKRPLQGKAAFLKKRTIPTMQDGLDLGFTPQSWNPVDSFLLKYAEMAQFLMGHQVLDVMKKASTAKFVRISDKPPDGWKQLDDRIGTVYRRVTAIDEDKLDDVTQPLTWPGGKRQIPGAFSEDIEDTTHGEIALVGHYYAPADAAKVFNNYVSKGLSGRFPIFDVVRWMNSNLNALQLGVSAFHASMITGVGAVSDIALGVQQLTEGKPVDFAAKVGRGILFPISALNTVRNGYRLMKEYLHPGSYAAMAKEAAAVATAGGRLKENTLQIKPLDKAINSFANGAILKGLSAVPGALLQTFTGPIMDHYVPLMKFGIFYGLAHDILDEQGRGKITAQAAQTRLNEAWNSVDNRAGQMVYRNLFWDRATLDVLQVATRSVGWNYGTIAEAGAALSGTGKAAVDIAQGKKPRLTPAMAFAMALPLTMGMWGAAANYMRTGHAPDTWKDYFYLRNSDGTYLAPPTYMKDVFSYAHDPAGTFANKLGPLWEATSEAVRNKDFYGTEIRHKDDPMVEQMAEVSKWAAKQAIPFAFSSAGKTLERRGAQDTLASMIEEGMKHPGDVLAGQLGFTPAPAFIQNSEALNKAREYQAENAPPGTRTKEQAERTRAMRVIENMYRTRTVDASAIREMVKSGVISERDRFHAQLESRTDPLVRAVRSLHPEQALNVYRSATAEEKKELRPVIEAKEREINNDVPRDQKEALKAAFRTALHPQPRFTGPSA